MTDAPKDRLRSLIPRSARERLYAWHPGRERRWRRFPGLDRLEPDNRAVLTFDDGPDEDATPAVLDALDAMEIQATFFIVAGQLNEHAEIAHETVRRGHEIGLHGHGHVRHDQIPPHRSREDLTRGFAALGECLGIAPRWYRPPYGKMSQAAAAVCAELGMTTVYWSGWGLDWENVPARRIVEVAGEQLEDGGILLLHDSARFARRTSALATAEAIGGIADAADERGIRLVSLGEGVLGGARA